MLGSQPSITSNSSNQQDHCSNCLIMQSVRAQRTHKHTLIRAMVLTTVSNTFYILYIFILQDGGTSSTWSASIDNMTVLDNMFIEVFEFNFFSCRCQHCVDNTSPFFLTAVFEEYKMSNKKVANQHHFALHGQVATVFDTYDWSQTPWQNMRMSTVEFSIHRDRR